MKTAYKSHYIITILRNPKDKFNLENHQVYNIQWSTFDRVYMGQSHQTTSSLFQTHLGTAHKLNFDTCKQLVNITHNAEDDFNEKGLRNEKHQLKQQ